MAKTNQKQTFLGGAAVLAVATAIVKIIGACYKIPLNQLIGDEGFGYFNTAYDIYSVLLMVSTTGLPVAMSRMISEAGTLGRTRQIRRIFQTARLVFLTIGLVGTGGMMLLCRQLAAMMSQELSWFAILCLSPAVLFICLISAERGFFQGQGNMIPTSVSQVFEAVFKLVVGLGAAYLINKKTGSMAYAAGGAILGVTLGTLFSTIYLALIRRRAMAELMTECPDPTVFSRRSTAKKLLAIAIPITLGAAGLQIITTIDAAVYMYQLKGAAGMAAEADRLKGIYNFCQTIFNLPCAFITPLTISVIPAITEQLTLRRRKSANMVAESAVRVMSLIAMPCSVGLAVLSEPIMRLLGGYTEARLTLASTLMSILGFCVFFNSFVLVMNAIMQAHGYVYTPVVTMILGGIVKIIINAILVGNPKINIHRHADLLRDDLLPQPLGDAPAAAPAAAPADQPLQARHCRGLDGRRGLPGQPALYGPGAAAACAHGRLDFGRRGGVCGFGAGPSHHHGRRLPPAAKGRQDRAAASHPMKITRIFVN